MTKPRTRSVARMEAAAAAAAEEEAGNPDGVEGAAVAAVAPEAAAEGPSEPNAGEASREPDAGQASREPGAAGPSREPDVAGPSREPDAAGPSREPGAAGGSREPGAAGGSRQPVPDAAQLAVVPYVEDIDRYLRSLEAEQTRRPMINYVQEIQGGIINMDVRGILVDWMADVAYVFNLQEETLHHAVVAMEANILSFLNFQMGSPTVITFLRRFLFSCRGSNNLSVQRITGYKVSDIEDCIRSIHDLQAGRKWSNLRAIRSKYEDDAFERVSTIPSPNTIKPSFLRDLKTLETQTEGSVVVSSHLID
uniref:Cyclin N-terminal domain-containing protein n=1 Tax=Oryza rufipogon TaxID=4529 RepID=A0A0E0NRB9_ORYRU